jgi:hypothetical protein
MLARSGKASIGKSFGFHSCAVEANCTGSKSEIARSRTDPFCPARSQSAIALAEFELKSGFSAIETEPRQVMPNLGTTHWPVQKISARLAGSERQRTFSEKS